MTLFFLRPLTDSPDHFIVFPAGKAWQRAKKLLVEDLPDMSVPPFPLKAKAQTGLKATHFNTLDFFRSFGGVPIFSFNFREKMPQVKNEMDFFDCEIECERKTNRLLAGRIKRRLEIVDYEASGVGEPTNRFLPFKVRNDIPENFLIARERHPHCQSIYVVSEEFKKLAERAGLKIGFHRATS